MRLGLTSIGGVRAADVPSSDTSVRVLIFLYRASMNQHLRDVGRTVSPGMRPLPVSVNLHYLVSFWAKSGENEQLVLAWTMRQLREVPVLDSWILSREAAWTSEDLIQLIPEEIGTEELMRSGTPSSRTTVSVFPTSRALSGSIRTRSATSVR